MTHWEDQLIYRQGGMSYDVKPQTRKVALEVAAIYGDDLDRIIGATTWADHNTLLCLDFVGARAVQGKIVQYLLDNRERLKVENIINRSRMWRAYAKKNLRDSRGRIVGSYDAETWAPYGPRGDGSFIGTDNPHDDHAHTQLYDGTYVAPVQVRLVNLRPGKTNGDVRDLQVALMQHGFDIPDGPTTFYGGQTVAACKAFQRSCGWVGDAANGTPGPMTIQRLGLTLIP